MSECKPTEVDRLAQIIRTADGNHDMGAGALAERDNRVRADERAKLQDRIEELEKNLSYEVEQKIKLADTLRDERAKRSDLPCDGGCNVNDGPMEECSHHGRTPRDLWGIIEDLIQRLATERAKALDAHKCDEQAERAYRRAVAAEQALRDERAKRPDREQIAQIIADYEEYPHPRGYGAHADAILAVLALEPEADQELQDRIEVLEKNLAYEVAQKIKLAEQLQAATVTGPTLEQARWKLHAGIESRCSEEVAAEAKPVIDLVFSSLALEPETRETEVVEFNDGPAFRSKGMVHTLTVAPTSGGWLVTCQDFHGESSCNLPSGDAIKLAQMLHPEAREVTDAEAIVICRRDVPGTVPSWAGKDQIDPCRCVQMKGHDGACVCEHGLGHRPVREVE